MAEWVCRAWWQCGLDASVDGRLPSTIPTTSAHTCPPAACFWNELYVDPRAGAGIRALSRRPQAGALELSGSAISRRSKACRAWTIAGLMALKRPLLEAMARCLLDSKSERCNAFQDYVSRHWRLRDYAPLSVPSRKKQKSSLAGVAAAAARRKNCRPGKYIPAAERYHQYAQWLAEEQLQSLAARREAGVAGLYLDFPLGVHPFSLRRFGREHDVFALEASVGAPPDTLFTKGQNWNFPPLHPEALRRKGYSYWIESLRRQFQYSSAVRIDHVMGPAPAVLDSARARGQRRRLCFTIDPKNCTRSCAWNRIARKTTVVGENLGTVPAEVTHEMERRGLLPMYVLQYEARPDPKKCLRPVPPQRRGQLEHARYAPVLRAFCKGSDLSELERAEPVSTRRSTAKRARRRGAKVLDALRQFLLAGAGKRSNKRCGRESPGGKPAMAGAQRGQDGADQSRGPLGGDRAAKTFPGTSLERPNWQRKARYSLEDFSKSSRIRGAARLHRESASQTR